MLLEKLAEGSLIGKMQLFGNLADGDAFVVEALGGPLDQFIANHFVRRLTQNLLDQARKMLRRDAKFLGVEVRLMLDRHMLPDELHEIHHHPIAFANYRWQLIIRPAPLQHNLSHLEHETLEIDQQQFTPVSMAERRQRRLE